MKSNGEEEQKQYGGDEEENEEDGGGGGGHGQAGDPPPPEVVVTSYKTSKVSISFSSKPLKPPLRETAVLPSFPKGRNSEGNKGMEEPIREEEMSTLSFSSKPLAGPRESALLANLSEEESSNGDDVKV